MFVANQLRSTLGALVVATFAACAPEAPPAPPQAEPRLVVLVVVDTLRDDYLSAERMPGTLAALPRARRFVDTRANASWTLPSLASAFTSRPVLELTAPDGVLIGIPEAETTLAERFREAGFATGAFVANSTMREANGFAQGFDRFETPAKPFDPPTEGGALLAAAETFVAAHRERDTFVWIHLMEPHEPLVDHEERGRVAVDARVLAGRERAPTPEEATIFRDLYALEVERTDELLAAFLPSLPQHAVVAVVADHGEMLGEGTAWGHGATLYEPVLRVPFLLSAPGVEPGADPTPAQLLDLSPILLARAGIAAPEDAFAGEDLIGGAPAATVALADRPRLAATWSAGPLRWSYARGERAVLAHFALQPAAQEESRVKLFEIQPLPHGVWSYDRHRDPVAAHGSAPADGWLAEVAAAFAADVGTHSPGLHAIAIEQPAGVELVFEAAEEPRLARLLATSPATSRFGGGFARIAFEAPETLALVVFAPTARTRPAGPDWALGRAGPPPLVVPGRAFWRNPHRAVAQEPQQEIVEHLRALGYLR